MKLLRFELKQLVAKQLPLAFKRLKGIVSEDSTLYNEVIIQEGRFLDTLNYFDLSLTEKGNTDIEISKIRRGILAIIDNIKEIDIINSESLELSWWNEIPFEWEKAFEYLIGNNPTEKRVKYLFSIKDVKIESELITDLKPLSNLKQIENLTIQTPNVEDYSYIKNIHSLKSININISKKHTNLRDIFLNEIIEQIWLQTKTVYDIEINTIKLPNRTIVNDLKLSGFHIKSFNFMKQFLQVNNMTIEECEIKEIDFTFFDSVKLNYLYIDMNFDDEETIWSSNSSCSIKDLTVSRDRRLNEFKLHNLINRFPNLKVIRFQIEEFNTYYSFFELKNYNELPYFLMEALISNVAIIDLSNTHLHSERLLSLLLESEYKKKIILHKYDYKKLMKLKLQKQTNIDFINDSKIY